MRAKSLALYFLVLSAFPAFGAELPPDHAARMTKGLELFQTNVRALLIEHCVKCHGGEKTKGECQAGESRAGPHRCPAIKARHGGPAADEARRANWESR